MEALLETLDPDVEWHPGIAALLKGEATVRQGHEGVREWLRDVRDAFAEFHVELSEIMDLDDRIVAIGRLFGRGVESGADTESPVAFLVHHWNGRGLSFGSISIPTRPAKLRDCGNSAPEQLDA